MSSITGPNATPIAAQTHSNTNTFSEVTIPISNVGNVNETIRSRTSTSLENIKNKLTSGLKRIKGFIKNHTINISQIGPQITITCPWNGKSFNLKMTPTAVCTFDQFLCYFCHCETGKRIYSIEDIADIYILWLYHCGFGAKCDEGISCFPVFETLGHIEITKRYGQFQLGPLKVGIQGLAGFEWGTTVTSTSTEIKNIVENLPNPSTGFSVVRELYIKHIKNHFFPTNDGVINQLMPGFPVPAADGSDNVDILTTVIKPWIAQAIYTIAEKGTRSTNPNETIWFNFIIGPAEINSEIGFDWNGFLKPSIQVTNYFRSKATFIMRAGEFILPSKMDDFINKLIESIGYQKLHKALNELKWMSKEKAVGKEEVLTSIDILFNKIHDRLEKYIFNQSEYFLPALALASHCRFVVKDKENNFSYGYDQHGELIDAKDLGNDTHTTYVLGGDNTFSIAGKSVDLKNSVPQIPYNDNYTLLSYIHDNENHRRALADQIMQTLHTDFFL